jgi:hypothetical protein
VSNSFIGLPTLTVAGQWNAWLWHAALRHFILLPSTIVECDQASETMQHLII